MTRSAMLLSAALLTICPATLRAQGAASTGGPASGSAPPSVAGPAAPSPTQLDRIEQKLDEVLQRLQQGRPPLPAAAQGQGTSLEPPIPSQTPGGPPAASLAAYKPGALALVRPGPKDTASVSDVPSDTVGGFVYQGGPMTLSDMRARGVRYPGPVGVELQGWLRAREVGRYQIATDLTVRFAHNGALGPTCFLQAWLEGRTLDQRSVLVGNPGKPEATATLVVGADLQPGLYRLRVWTTCTAPQGVTTASELLIKTPAELNLRPATGSDLFHREE